MRKRLILFACAVAACALPAAASASDMGAVSQDLPDSSPGLALGLASWVLLSGAAVSKTGNSRQFSPMTSRKQCVVSNTTPQRSITSTGTTGSSQRDATPTQLNTRLNPLKYDREALRIRTLMAC